MLHVSQQRRHAAVLIFDRIRPWVKGSLSARWGNDNGDGIDSRTSFHLRQRAG